MRFVGKQSPRTSRHHLGGSSRVARRCVVPDFRNLNCDRGSALTRNGWTHGDS
jgi:hypothetical protein